MFAVGVANATKLRTDMKVKHPNALIKLAKSRIIKCTENVAVVDRAIGVRSVGRSIAGSLDSFAVLPTGSRIFGYELFCEFVCVCLVAGMLFLYIGY